METKQMARKRPRPVHRNTGAPSHAFPNQLASILSGPPESSKKRKLSDLLDINNRVQSLKASSKEATPVQTSRSSRSNSKHRQSDSRASTSLQKSWDRIARKAGAAKVAIVNDIDDEDAPPVESNFQYLENRCTYATDVPDPQAVANKTLIHGCMCAESCNNYRKCSCIYGSRCIGANGGRTTAYDENGLFLFTDGGEVVIECNEKCLCSRGCSNRVAQKPRNIPIEIFKTNLNGWGVRSPIAISQGTVIGIYTGKIMKLEAIDDLSEKERNYTFEINASLSDNVSNAEQERYIVCAYAEGNWTRFTNHSCSPNVEVFSVNFDGTLEANIIPYLAFVASEDIPAREEITIDYGPETSRSTIAGQNADEKNNLNASASETQCLCGSKNCRGIIPGGRINDDTKNNNIEGRLKNGPVRYSKACDRCIRNGVECQGMLSVSCFSCVLLKEECKYELGGLRHGSKLALPFYSSAQPFLDSGDDDPMHPGARSDHARSNETEKPAFAMSGISPQMIETTAQAFEASALAHSACAQSHEACIRMQNMCTQMQRAWDQVFAASIQMQEASAQMREISRRIGGDFKVT